MPAASSVCGCFLFSVEVGGQSGKWKSHNIGSATQHKSVQLYTKIVVLTVRLHFQDFTLPESGWTRENHETLRQTVQFCHTLVDAIRGSIYGQAGAIRRDDLGMSRPSTHNQLPRPASEEYL